MPTGAALQQLVQAAQDRHSPAQYIGSVHPAAPPSGQQEGARWPAAPARDPRIRPAQEQQPTGGQHLQHQTPLAVAAAPAPAPQAVGAAAAAVATAAAAAAAGPWGQMPLYLLQDSDDDSDDEEEEEAVPPLPPLPPPAPFSSCNAEGRRCHTETAAAVPGRGGAE